MASHCRIFTINEVKQGWHTGIPGLVTAVIFIFSPFRVVVSLAHFVGMFRRMGEELHALVRLN